MCTIYISKRLLVTNIILIVYGHQSILHNQKLDVMPCRHIQYKPCLIVTLHSLHRLAPLVYSEPYIPKWTNDMLPSIHCQSVGLCLQIHTQTKACNLSSQFLIRLCASHKVSPEDTGKPQGSQVHINKFVDLKISSKITLTLQFGFINEITLLFECGRNS